MGWKPVFITINVPFGKDFSSSGVISGRSVICNDCDGSFLPLLTEPVRTVRFPRALERISAEEEFGAKPPNKVSWVLSMIMSALSFP